MGVLGVFVKESNCSAETCALLRFGIGLFLVLPLYLLRPKHKGFSPQAAISGIGIGLCILFYFMAIQGVSVGIAALLPATGPIFATIGEALITRRCPPLRNCLLMLGALAGIVLVCAPGICGGGEVKYYLYGMLSGVFYGVYLLLNRLIPPNIKNMQRAFWQFVAGFLVLALPFAWQADPFAPVHDGSIQWPYLLCIGVFQGYVVMICAAYAMKHLSAIRYGTIAYLEPTVAVAMGWLVYSDEMSVLQWLGVLMVLAASVVQSLLPAKETPLKWRDTVGGATGN